MQVCSSQRLGSLGRDGRTDGAGMKYKTWHLGVIHWKINGTTGHGSAIPYDTAVAWVEKLNEKYGAGTHWVKRTR